MSSVHSILIWFVTRSFWATIGFIFAALLAANERSDKQKLKSYKGKHSIECSIDDSEEGISTCLLIHVCMYLDGYIDADEISRYWSPATRRAFIEYSRDITK